MIKINPITLEDFEKEDIQWWCRHHKQAVATLVVRLQQIIDGDKELLKIMEAQLPGFIKGCNLEGYINEKAE